MGWKASPKKRNRDAFGVVGSVITPGSVRLPRRRTFEVDLMYRVIISAHYFFGVHLSPELYFFGTNCLYTANVVGIIGNVILCRTLKLIVNNAAEETNRLSDASHSSRDKTIWPPPPQGRL
jgi:hypothetical protein